MLSDDVDFDLLERQVVALLEHERSFLANSANFAAFIYTSLPNVNWAGFYFPHADALVLGPFGGKPACTRLPNGRGVCGQAFKSAATVIVDDVDAFADHIVCDSASRSEMVVPLLKEGSIYGVFDIDSPVVARFSSRDKEGVEKLVARYVELTPLPSQYRSGIEGGARVGERIDIQTCRDHHVVLRYLIEDLNTEADATRASDLFARLRNVLVAHLRLEDNWLYPRLTESANPFVSSKARGYREAMGGLREHFNGLWARWSPHGEIAKNFHSWKNEWDTFAERLEARVQAEDDDLYAAAEADLT